MPLPEKKFIRKDELDDVLRWLRTEPADERGYMLVLLSAALGLRATEAVRASKDWFRDLSSGWVWVRSAKQRAEERPEDRLPIPPQIARDVKRYLAGLEGRWLFPGKTDEGHLSERQAFNIFSEACQAVGLGHKSFHALRHYRGFTVQSKKGDLDWTRRMLRHKDAKVTQMYTERTPDEEQDLAEEIGW